MMKLGQLPVGSAFRVEGTNDMAKLVSINSCAAVVELKGNKTYTIHAHDSETGEPKEVKFTGPRRSTWALGTVVTPISLQDLETKRSSIVGDRGDGPSNMERENEMNAKKKTAKKSNIKTSAKPTNKKKSIKESAAPTAETKKDNPFPYSMQELHRLSGVSVLTLRKYVINPELLKQIPHDTNQRGLLIFNDASVKAVTEIKKRNQQAAGTKS